MFNNYGANFQYPGSQYYQGTQNSPYGNYNNAQPMTNNVNTNIIRVTSLEEAVMRSTVPGSDMVYFHQDKDTIYRVKVDFDGKKSWVELNISVPNPNASIPATKADLEALTLRLETLEKSMTNTESQVSENG